jgi:TIR domain-containing protein
MSQASPTPKREGASPPGVTKLAWPLIALGCVLIGLSLFFFLKARSYRLPQDEAHRNCFIEFAKPDAHTESAVPTQSAQNESLPPPGIQEAEDAQLEFTLASFNLQDSSQPTPTQTPDAGQKRGKRKGVRRIFDWLRGKSSKEPVENPARRRPTPPRLDASTYNVVLCPGRESDALVQITASGFDSSCPPLAYHWRVDAGRIEGRGARVVWNLRDVPPGKYRATFKADINQDCYDCRDCDVFGFTKITVRSCTTTTTPTPTPTPTPTQTPTPKPTPAYTCPNVYCSAVTHGNFMTFTAQTSGGTPNVSPMYRWTVSAGRIRGGQGTSSIQVDTTGLAEGTEINANAGVSGYGRICIASCTSLVGSTNAPTPTPTPTPSPSPTPSPPSGNLSERQIVSLHYPKALTKGQDATISFTWTKTYAEAEQKGNVRTSSAPRMIPASFTQTADEQSSGAIATIHLHSNDLNPKTWSLQLPLGEERSLTINPANYAGREAFTLEVDALEVDGSLWKRADAGYWFRRQELDPEECGGHSFVITVSSPPRPYIPMALLLCGTIALLAGDYLRRMAQGAALKEMEESMLAESPAAATEGDDVRCTVFAPTEAKQGKSFMVIAFAHLAAQAGLLAEMAKGMSKSVEQRGPGKKLGAKIERGQELLFSLEMAGLEIDEPNQSITWEGEPDSVQFGVTIPKDFEPGSIIATVRVAYKSVPVGHVKFEFEVVEGAPRVEKPATAAAVAPPVTAPVSFDNYVQYKQVFISYASQDRAEVLKRVQVLSMMKLNFFQDLLTLEPGDDWEKTIYQYLDRSDAVFLFWSSHAKKSEWVEKELRYVLSRKEAAPEIVPIIIEAPAPLPPPDYLSSLHFNDKIMYLIKVEEERREDAQPNE